MRTDSGIFDLLFLLIGVIRLLIEFWPFTLLLLVIIILSIAFPTFGKIVDSTLTVLKHLAFFPFKVLARIYDFIVNDPPPRKPTEIENKQREREILFRKLEL